mgnify:CR=1 FL=1
MKSSILEKYQDSNKLPLSIKERIKDVLTEDEAYAADELVDLSERILLELASVGISIYLSQKNQKDVYNDFILDLFTSKGFGWVRYSGSNSRTTNFKIRYLGGKNTKGINLSLNNETAINLENLEGVPHKLGLEEGIFEKSIKKEKIEIEVSKEELNSFGIQTLESFLKEDA